MRFQILGRSVGKIKKNAKIKLEKESGARRPGTSAYYPWSLKTTRCGYKVSMAATEEGKIDFVLRIKQEQYKEKTKICKAKNCLCFRLKSKLFETMCHCLLRNFFFFENAKIWVGRTTLNREKKGMA